MLDLDSLLKRKIFTPIIDKITEAHREEIKKIINFYDNKTIKNRLKNIYHFIDFDVSPKEINWLDRLQIITNTIGQDNSSDYALYIRYGSNSIEVKNKINSNRGSSLEKYIKKYGETLGKLKYEEYCSVDRNSWGLENMTKRYGPIEGKIKWEKSLAKKISTQKKHKEINGSYSNGQTLKEYVLRYGIVKGFKKYFLKNKKISYRFSLEFFINKYGRNKGLIKHSEYKSSMDKTSLSSFMTRYGNEEGKLKYQAHVNKVKFNNSIEGYIERYGEEEGIKKRSEWLDKIMFKNIPYSKISQELFNSLRKEVEPLTDKKIYYAKHNGEFVIKTDKGTFFLDFKIGNLIIEFDGDYWHSKKEQILKDEIKTNALKEKGYKVIRVKEKEFRKDPKKVIEKLLLKIKKYLNE